MDLPGTPWQPGWGSGGHGHCPSGSQGHAASCPCLCTFSPPPAWFSFKQPDKYFTLTMLCKLTLLLHWQGMGSRLRTGCWPITIAWPPACIRVPLFPHLRQSVPGWLCWPWIVPTAGHVWMAACRCRVPNPTAQPRTPFPFPAFPAFQRAAAGLARALPSPDQAAMGDPCA